MATVDNQVVGKGLVDKEKPVVDEREAFLRKNLLDTPDRSPEDVKSELIEKLDTKSLRENTQGVAPEDTRSEILASMAKEDRKLQDADLMRRDREAAARSWNDEQAKARVNRDVTEHADFVALGKRGEGDSFYLRADMALRASVNPSYESALKSVSPELYSRVQENQKENITINVAASGADVEAKRLADIALKKQLEEDLKLRKQRETTQATQGGNTVDVQKSGKEIERDDLILPRALQNNYSEQNGKFFAKDSNRLVFEDKGEKLATSSFSKQAVADMVLYARAKQWESIKLSGSQDFRREAWLQAESQGIKTQGFTPKEADLAALKTLSQERQTNIITPVAERQETKEKSQNEVNAPRHDLNKNQAVIHIEASKSVGENMKKLEENRKFDERDPKEMARLAFWRGVVIEDNKLQPKATQDEALAKFDKFAENPEFLKKLEEKTQTTTIEKTVEKTVQRDRDVSELSL